MTLARVLVSFALSFSLAQTAAAQAPQQTRRVELVFEGEWDAAIVQDVRDDLASAHALLGVPTGTSGESLVRIVFAHASETTCRITATNALAERELSREVSLEGLTPDATGIVLAAAADELVAATWPEDWSFLTPPPREAPPAPPAPPPPPPVVEAPPSRRQSVSLAASLDLYGSGQVHFGLDVRYAFLPIDVLGFAIRLGYRRALPEDTARGRVDTRAYSGALEIFARLFTRSRVLRLDPFALLRLGAVGFSSSAESAVLGTVFERALSLRGGARFVLAPSALVRPVLEASIGGPLRSVVATDDKGLRLTGVYGVEVGFAASVELAW